MVEMAFVQFTHEANVSKHAPFLVAIDLFIYLSSVSLHSSRVTAFLSFFDGELYYPHVPIFSKLLVELCRTIPSILRVTIWWIPGMEEPLKNHGFPGFKR
jgi:hypothetical protein